MSDRQGGGIDRLLVQVKIYAHGLEVLDGAKQVDQRPAEPINGPRHYHIELAPAGVLEQGVEPWPLVTALGATDGGVTLDFNNAAAFGDLPERQCSTIFARTTSPWCIARLCERMYSASSFSDPVRN